MILLIKVNQFVNGWKIVLNEDVFKLPTYV